ERPAFKPFGACAGRRGDVRAGADPVVSPSGSAVMMLTGGIEFDDGKNTSGPAGRDPANADAAGGSAGDAAAGGSAGETAAGIVWVKLAVGPGAGCGQTVECRAT